MHIPKAIDRIDMIIILMFKAMSIMLMTTEMTNTGIMPAPMVPKLPLWTPPSPPSLRQWHTSIYAFSDFI